MEQLPVELLYEVELYASSDAFPHVSSYLHNVFKSAPVSWQIQYILGRIGNQPPNELYTRALRYPSCSQDVFVHLVEKHPQSVSLIELPRRLFRSLKPKNDPNVWSEGDPPLPFLRYLFLHPTLPKPKVDSYDGYALTKAVHVRFKLLVDFLLTQGASPSANENLSVIVAIRQKDLALVKTLIERPRSTQVSGKKRRRLEDRLKVTPAMLKVAVKCNARDIVHYFTEEKGCVPDLATLRMMT